MAFKRARYSDLYYRKSLIDESTEEILDYLIRSRGVLNDLTFERLRYRLGNSLSKRILNFLQEYFKGSRVNNKSLTLAVLLSVISGINSFNPAMAFSLKQETRTPIQNFAVNQPLIHGAEVKSSSKEELNGLDINNQKSGNVVISVAEEQKNNLAGIRPGNSLLIIPKNAKVHEVQKGEDLVKISNKYKVPIKELINANFRVDILNLHGGEKIIIPAVKTMNARSHRYKLASRGFAPSLSFSPSAGFNWPALGVTKISSNFGYRWNRRHEGIDIPARVGTPILASRSGVVESSGWQGDYGKCVVINHGDGTKTRYAHASKLLVRTGEYVQAGKIVARVGNTGRSTGPHLHFEVIVNGIPRDPHNYL